MTITRAVLLFFCGLMLTDRLFGNGRLIQAVSDQSVQLGYKLSDEFSSLERRIAVR
jgi:hypothetical protein